VAAVEGDLGVAHRHGAEAALVLDRAPEQVDAAGAGGDGRGDDPVLGEQAEAVVLVGGVEGVGVQVHAGAGREGEHDRRRAPGDGGQVGLPAAAQELHELRRLLRVPVPVRGQALAAEALPLPGQVEVEELAAALAGGEHGGPRVGVVAAQAALVSLQVGARAAAERGEVRVEGRRQVDDHVVGPAPHHLGAGELARRGLGLDQHPPHGREGAEDGVAGPHHLRRGDGRRAQVQPHGGAVAAEGDEVGRAGELHDPVGHDALVHLEPVEGGEHSAVEGLEPPLGVAGQGAHEDLGGEVRVAVAGGAGGRLATEGERGHVGKMPRAAAV